MSIDASGSAGRRRRATGRGMIIAIVSALVLTMAMAVPALATVSATATLAPIGSGSYVLTVTNTGTEPITGFIGATGEEPVPTNLTPSSCVFGNTPIVASITCTIAIAPGASGQMCYTGRPFGELVPGVSLLLNGGTSRAPTITAAPPVSSCPVPGFKATSPGTGTTGNSGGSTKCLVPSVKGKTLAAAEKAITKAHCAVGKVKKAKSSHVKKGRIVSQGAGAGRSLPNGTKISLVLSRGK